MNLLIPGKVVDRIHQEVLTTSHEQLAEDIAVFRVKYPEVSFWWAQRGSNPQLLLGLYMAFRFIEESYREQEITTDINPKIFPEEETD